jgi:hypothetical protein
MLAGQNPQRSTKPTIINKIMRSAYPAPLRMRPRGTMRETHARLQETADWERDSRSCLQLWHGVQSHEKRASKLCKGIKCLQTLQWLCARWECEIPWRGVCTVLVLRWMGCIVSATWVMMRGGTRGWRDNGCRPESASYESLHKSHC